MAFIRVNSGFTNTITEVSDNPIVNLQADEFQASTNFLFPPSQPVFFYRYNDVGMNVEINPDNVINDYELSLDETAEIAENLEQTVFDLQTVVSAISGATGGGGGEDLAVLQLRRTTALNNVPLAYTDFTFDTTSVENNTDVIEHDPSNDDRILIKEDGFYQIGYQFSADDEARGRVRVNDTTVLDGSIARFGPVGDTVDLFGNAAANFVAQLSAGDFLTLQVEATTGSENIDPDSGLYVIKLTGAKGQKGDAGSGTSINVSNEGVAVSGSPFDTLDFTGATITSDGSTAKILIQSNSTPPPICQLIDSAGGQALNNVTENPIEWGTQDIIDGTVFSHTGGQSTITVLQNGQYEISFNVNGDGGNNRSTVGVQFRLNGSPLAPTLTASYIRNNNNDDSSNTLPPFTVNLTNGDELDVVAFRLGDSTAVVSKAGASFVKIKYLG